VSELEGTVESILICDWWSLEDSECGVIGKLTEVQANVEHRATKPARREA
jgi:hypothetical protein